MTTSMIAAIVISLCPNLKKMDNKYSIQNERVNCMEYYTNDIVNNPDKYKELLNNVKSR